MNTHADSDHPDHSATRVWFEPNKICLTLSCLENIDESSLKTALDKFFEQDNEWLNSLCQDEQQNIKPQIRWSANTTTETKIISLNPQTENSSPTSSMWMIQVMVEHDDSPNPTEFLAFIYGLQESINPLEGESRDTIDSPYLSLNRRDDWNKVWKEIGVSVTLEHTLPNVLISSTPHTGTDGGPGSYPIQARTVQETCVLFPAFNVTSNQGEGITIFVLDTWTEEPDGTLNRDPQLLTQLGITSVTDTNFAISTPNHEGYDMSYHGPFVAHYLHTIAPAAEIHVYKILNKYGVGSYASLLEQWMNISAEITPLRPTQETDPLKVRYVMNCSFVVNMPSSEFLTNQLSKAVPETPQSISTDLTMRKLAHWLRTAMDKSLETIVNLLFDTQTMVILSASGNDGHDQLHGEANLLAQLELIYGVGALNSRGTIASYSNLADHIHSDGSFEGFLIFGGDSVFDDGQPNHLMKANRGLASNEHGLMGPYRGSTFYEGWDSSTSSQTIIEDANPEPTGWAYWAGTSFATAIMSGLVASVASDRHVNRDELIAFIRTRGTNNLQNKGTDLQCCVGYIVQNSDRT